MSREDTPMNRAVCTVAATLVFASTSAAPPRPDFSGTWTMDEARSVSPTFDSFVGPVVWTIRQTADQMTVDIKRGPKSFTLTYKLYDKVPTGPPTGAAAYRGYWEGDVLVTETAQEIQGQTVTTREMRRLQPGGSEMLVERLVKVEHGYTLRGAQSYNTAKDIFVRAAR
jgi:hypothetical protein